VPLTMATIGVTANSVKLIDWLRSKGVTSKTPLHTLRKEFGTQINARYGLTAAQEMLRHADVAVTAAHYVENKQRIGPGLRPPSEERSAHESSRSPRRRSRFHGPSDGDQNHCWSLLRFSLGIRVISRQIRLWNRIPCGRRYKQATRT
jgi:hypothetical protein